MTSRKSMFLWMFLMLLLLPVAGFAQDAGTESGWQPMIIPLIQAAVPLVSWLLITGLKKVWAKIPKVVTVLLPTAFGVVIGMILKATGTMDNVILVAVLSNLAIAIQEVQQKVAEWISSGEAKSLVALVSKKA
jgi:hypothetical protein